MNKWLLKLKYRNLVVKVSKQGYVYDQDSGNKRLYVLTKQAMSEIRDIILNHIETIDAGAPEIESDNVVKFYDGENKLEIYSRDLLHRINDFMLKSENRKHGDSALDEIIKELDQAMKGGYEIAFTLGESTYKYIPGAKELEKITQPL